MAILLPRQSAALAVFVSLLPLHTDCHNSRPNSHHSIDATVEIPWNAKQQQEQQQQKRQHRHVMRAEGGRAAESSLIASAFLETRESSQIVSTQKGPRDYKPPCAFMQSTGSSHMKCVDDSICDPFRHGADCCAKHGGRAMCPVGLVMCANKKCADDYCCAPHCDHEHFGGLRHCSECYEAVRGFRDSGYRGCQSVTRSGKTCQSWDGKLAHDHSITSLQYPLADLRENYCRNPSGRESIWCFTNDTESDVEWEFCDPQDALSFTEDGSPKCGVPLPLVGSRTNSRLHDKWITASSYQRDLYGDREASGKGAMWRSRLDADGSAWRADSSDSEPWIQWDFVKAKQIQKIQTKGYDGSNKEWVTQYKLAFSPDGVEWTLLDPLFEGNQDQTMVAENSIDPPIVARFVRLYPTGFQGKSSLRADFFGCNAPQNLAIAYHASECCDGTDCNQALELPNYVDWAHCHGACESDPKCTGFQFGKDNDAEQEEDKCTAPGICACWLITGTCQDRSPNPSYDAYMFRPPITPMRLVMDKNGNATVSHKGVLEIYRNSAWGTVCGDLFSENSAKVACRQMGMFGGKIMPSRSYTIGTGPIWMDDVRCGGHEPFLWNCFFNGWGKHDCDHSRDVGIECLAPDDA